MCRYGKHVPLKAFVVLFLTNRLAALLCHHCSYREESEEAQAVQAERNDTASSLRSSLGGLMKRRQMFAEGEFTGHLLHAEQADLVRKFLRYPR